MDHHGEPDVPDRGGHAPPDPDPLLRRPIDAVDAAVVLLVEPVGIRRADADAVWVVEGDAGGVESLHDLHAADQRPPGAASVDRLVHPAARHADVQVRRVARVHEDGVELRPVGRSVLGAAHPLPVTRVVVQAGDRVPGGAAILGPEKPVRRGAGVPGAWLGRVTRREPEGVVDDPPLRTVTRLRKHGGTFRLLATSLPGRWTGRPSGPGDRSSPRRGASARRANRGRAAFRTGRGASRLHGGPWSEPPPTPITSGSGCAWSRIV